MGAKPIRVWDAIRRGDTPALRAMGRAGGRARSGRHTPAHEGPQAILEEVLRQMALEEAARMAFDRRDHLIPEGDQ